MKYVDGFVLPVPKKNLPAYRRMAAKADPGLNILHVPKHQDPA